MSPRGRWWWWLCMLAAVSGCPDGELEAATQLVVVVHSDVQVPASLNSLRVSVQTADGRSTVAAPFPFALKADADPAEGMFTLPLSFGITRAAHGATSLRVVIQGYGPVVPGGADGLLIEQKALVSFVDKQTLRLVVFLGHACFKQLCEAASPDSVCYANSTTEVAAGECGPIPQLTGSMVTPQRELEGVPFDPPAEVATTPEPATDAGSESRPDSASAEPLDTISDSGAPARPVDNELDLLFMIDNSSGMDRKQSRLAEALPRLFSALTSGDRCAGLVSCPYDNDTKPSRMFPAVSSLHLGVVTSNAGGIDAPPSQDAIASCQGLGDDGKLQQDLTIAKSGVTARKLEFSGYEEGDVVLEPLASCAQLTSLPLYQDYSVGSGQLSAVERDFACAARVGLRGCPFEQQLESVWKALAPSEGSDADFTFLNASRGQGDRHNAGFLRERAQLAILLLTDEDDCSILDAGKVLFAQSAEAEQEFGAVNLRCGLQGRRADLIQELGRYTRGFDSLKPLHPERVLFAAITGVPVDAVAAGLSLDEILSLPRMQFAADPNRAGFPLSACELGGERASPATRIVQLANAFGERGLVSSICAQSYAPAIDGLLAKLSERFEHLSVP